MRLRNPRPMNLGDSLPNSVEGGGKGLELAKVSSELPRFVLGFPLLDCPGFFSPAVSAGGGLRV